MINYAGLAAVVAAIGLSANPPAITGLDHIPIAVRDLDRAITRLPAEQRACIKLAVFEGLTHSQIAERLAAPLGTVKSRIRMGMMKIREAVEERDARMAPVASRPRAPGRAQALRC